MSNEDDIVAALKAEIDKLRKENQELKLELLSLLGQGLQPEDFEK